MNWSRKYNSANGFVAHLVFLRSSHGVFSVCVGICGVWIKILNEENCKTNEEQTGLSVKLSPFVHVCVLNVFGFFVLT